MWLHRLLFLKLVQKDRTFGDPKESSIRRFLRHFPSWARVGGVRGPVKRGEGWRFLRWSMQSACQTLLEGKQMDCPRVEGSLLCGFMEPPFGGQDEGDSENKTQSLSSRTAEFGGI